MEHDDKNGNPPPGPARPHADAALLALGRAFDAAWAAERALPGNTPDATADAAHGAVRRIVERILVHPAATVDGLAVKARVLLWCGYQSHEVGPDLFGDTLDLRIAGAVLRDLLHLNGAE